MQVRISDDALAIACGADAVAERFEALGHEVVRTSSWGMHWLGPLVEIEGQGYGPAAPGDTPLTPPLPRAATMMDVRLPRPPPDEKEEDDGEEEEELENELDNEEGDEEKPARMSVGALMPMPALESEPYTPAMVLRMKSRLPWARVTTDETISEPSGATAISMRPYSPIITSSRNPILCAT